MISLDNVTLIALTGLNYKFEEHKEALKKSCKDIEFGEITIVQLQEIVDIESWNKAVIYELPKYVKTSHCLLMHDDAEIVNPDLWDNEWLSLDYIGSPWPLPRWDGEFKDTLGRVQRVGNSVSLRSKKLMDLVATREMEFHYGNNNEDGEICVWQRAWLEQQGCKFATFEQALKFGRETLLPETPKETFLIHAT